MNKYHSSQDLASKVAIHMYTLNEARFLNITTLLDRDSVPIHCFKNHSPSSDFTDTNNGETVSGPARNAENWKENQTE